MEPRMIDKPAFNIMGAVAHGKPDKMDFNAVWTNQHMPHDGQERI